MNDYAIKLSILQNTALKLYLAAQGRWQTVSGKGIKKLKGHSKAKTNRSQQINPNHLTTVEQEKASVQAQIC